MAKTRIIIVGGGFAGVKCAKTLCRGLDQANTKVYLFSDENHLAFSPLLAEARVAVCGFRWLPSRTSA